MALSTHVSGHVDKLTALVRQVGKLSIEVARLQRIVRNDALVARGYHLEIRPDADPPGLYIVKPNPTDESGNRNGEEATHICP